MSTFLAILNAIKAIPQIIKALKELMGLAGDIKEAIEKKNDEGDTKDEIESARNGGRPSAS